MYRIRLLLSFSAILVLLSCEKNSSENALGFISDSLDSLFATASDFSGVILVADHGKPVYHKAFGYRAFDEQVAQDTNSIFELASVSKQFTAMAIMMLQHEGRVNFDDPIEKYIPIPYPGITIRHLLHHTSGLPDYQAVMDQHWDKNLVAGNDDNIAYLIKYRPASSFSPGEKFEYSNTGYMLLATIAERASGKDFIALCNEKIFRPLKMEKTSIRTKVEKLKIPEIAWGHIHVQEKGRYIRADSFPEFNYTIWLGDRKGPGRVSATASDILKWDRALYGKELVPAELIAEAFTPATLNDGSVSQYGFGWYIQEHATHGKIVYHNGDNPGYATTIVRYLEQDLTVILLSKNAHAKFDSIAAGVRLIVENVL